MNPPNISSSTRPVLSSVVIGLWIISCATLFVLVLVAPPATGQTNYPWSPREARLVESAGEIVLTFRFAGSEPSRVVYYTHDGDCPRYPGDPPECGRPQARESEDYGPVKGEWIFTEAGSRTIRIPIYDDDLDEPQSEAFVVFASMYDDVAEQTGWYNATVHIADDDPKGDADAPSDGTSPTATAARGRSPSSSNAKAISGSDNVDAEVQPGSGSELASGELEPGTGSEPRSVATSKPVPERDGRSGDSASWLALGLGAIALASVGVAWVRRRRRWS